MPRKRMIDPALFTSETVAALPIATRLTWIGFWTYADDHGHAKDNPSLVKAAVWPLDDTYTARKVSADLDRLVSNGSLCRYECCGQKQLHIPTWLLWQKVSHPAETKLCPCPTHEPHAAEIHATDSGVIPENLARTTGPAPRSVVEVNRDKSSSRDAPASPCPHGLRRVIGADGFSNCPACDAAKPHQAAS